MKAFWALVLFVTTALILPVASFAQVKVESKQPIIIPKTTVINQDYFVANQMVQFSGTVNGDMYAAGGSVLIDGNVNGDILVAGGQITIRGTVLHNIRSIGGNILIDGTVGGNVTAVGGTVTITNGARVGGSLVGAGGQYFVLGSIGKTIAIAGGQTTIGTTIGGNAWIGAKQITLLPTAKINGDLAYVSETNADIQQGAIIFGKTTHTLPPQPEKKKEVENKNVSQIATFFAGFALIIGIIKLLFEFLIGLLIFQFIPTYTKRTIEQVVKKPWLSFGIGLLFLASAPIIGIILLITIIGIPLVFVEVFIVAVCIFVGKIFAITAISQLLLQKINKKIHIAWSLLIGLIVFALLMLIPILGWIIGCIICIIGFGAVLMIKSKYYIELREKDII